MAEAAPKCPYLPSVDRSVLDFDLPIHCSVTLSTQHVYACLVCGTFFGGRGKSTPAYAHSVDAGHSMFLSLSDGVGRVYCLPDGYEVVA